MFCNSVPFLLSTSHAWGGEMHRAPQQNIINKNWVDVMFLRNSLTLCGSSLSCLCHSVLNLLKVTTDCKTLLFYIRLLGKCRKSLAWFAWFPSPCFNVEYSIRKGWQKCQNTIQKLKCKEVFTLTWSGFST